MILITGGLGLLGSRIADNLIHKGHQIRIASRRRNDIILPKELETSELVSIDLTDKESLDEICKNISVIIHLASTNASTSLDRPNYALEINGLGTFNLLEAAKKNNVNHFIYFSTAHVYSSPLTGFINEEILTLPKHHYAITHKLAEDYVFQATSNSKINATVFRLSNAVGSPILKDTNCWMLVVNDLVKQVVSNRKMVFRSHQYEQRDFFPISDVCEAINTDLIRQRSSKFELFNLGSSKSISLGELSEIISKCTQEVLGFTPDVSFPKETKNNNLESNTLIYSNEKMLNNGFKIEGDLRQEISNLLLNANDWFTSEK
jgi:UDP-glucose 4-epimerase